MVPRITDPAILAGYLTDASNTHGSAEALLRPESAEEVAEILAYCQQRSIPLTVTAQRTSTTGGPVPKGGWLLSTERLNRVLSIDGQHAEAEAGVLLGAFQDEIERRSLFYPPDPTSRNECSLGGSIACNASGARTYRYGPTRPWVEELQIALPDGTLLRADRDTPIPADWPRPQWTEPKVKTAAGIYPATNLMDLFIGQEGMLGVITRARVRLIPLPERVFSVWVFFPSASAGLAFVAQLRGSRTLSPRLIEWFDTNSLDLIRQRVPELPPEARAAVWCEQECEDGSADALIEAWAAEIEGSEALSDATVFADDAAGMERLRQLRHALPAGVNELISRSGLPKVGTDFAVPDAGLAALMAAYEAVPMRHVLFGHIGDNHLHLNLLPQSQAELIQARQIWAELFRLAISLGGTVSAEHGIGKLKRQYLAEMVGEETLGTFRALKRRLDPNWILGRDTMIDAPV